MSTTVFLPLLVDDDPDGWQLRAVCAETDPEAFFPEKGKSPKAAKNVCGGCSVRLQCLTDALRPGDADYHGVRGGFTARERRKMHKAVDTGVDHAVVAYQALTGTLDQEEPQ